MYKELVWKKVEVIIEVIVEERLLECRRHNRRKR